MNARFASMIILLLVAVATFVPSANAQGDEIPRPDATVAPASEGAPDPFLGQETFTTAAVSSNLCEAVSR
jgi:hypothetical protein